jgi:hypothetical protein
VVNTSSSLISEDIEIICKLIHSFYLEKGNLN